MSFLTRFTRSRRPSAKGRTTAAGGPTTDGPATDEGTTDARPVRATGDAAAGDTGGRRGRRRAVAWVLTALACLLVLFALIAPSRLDQLTPLAFVRVPVEALVGVALILVLPARVRRPAAVLFGVVFGLLAIVKAVDMGFYQVLDRPFDLAFDWPLLGDGFDYVTKTNGQAGAIGAAVAVAALVIAVPALMALSVLRLSRLAVRHNARTTRAITALGVVWVACAVLGAHIVPGVPVASVAVDRPLQVQASLRDQKTFAAEVAVDAYRDTPGKELLTALRGKDVILTFVESYGRVAIEDPKLGLKVGAVLDEGNRRLRKAGYASRSAFLTSSTKGGVSWLAHGTLLSGMWINNQHRYTDLVASDRLTLNRAFKRAGWQTVGVMPGVTQAWPEAKFFGYDRVHAAKDLGYRGPVFSWSPMPDQYALAKFQKYERAKRDHAPLMAEIPLTSTHSPWAPIPRLIGWDDLGDGSVYAAHAKAGRRPDAVWRDPAKVRTEYGRSVEYTVNTLISYVENYGDDDLVLVFLGDHQPYSVVTGANPNRDVPITIVARDQAVLDRISGWGWHDGLKPGPRAPVWPMSAFRDRFLTAFGPQARPAHPPAPQARPAPSRTPR